MLSKMSKEQLELLSYTKIAEMYLKENKKTMNTADLFKEVCRLLELSDEEYQDKIADFFESLTTSKDFILLSDGNWDLRINHSVKIDMDDIYDEADTEDEISEEEDDAEMSEEDNYEDDSYDKDIDDDDLVDDDYSDLSIVDEEELDSDN